MEQRPRPRERRTQGMSGDAFVDAAQQNSAQSPGTTHRVRTIFSDEPTSSDAVRVCLRWCRRTALERRGLCGLVRGVDPRLHWFRGAGRARFGLGCAQVVDEGGLSLGQLKAAHQRPGGVGEPDRSACALFVLDVCCRCGGDRTRSATRASSGSPMRSSPTTTSNTWVTPHDRHVRAETAGAR